MTDRDKDLQYEQLYEQLLSRGEALHKSNKKRIKNGLILLVLLPFILGFIIWVTNSSKIVFLLIWILFMFGISAYLISVEYIDESLSKTLTDVTDREAAFDRLLPKASGRELQERIRDRLAERIAARAAEEDARINEAAAKIESEIRAEEAAAAEAKAAEAVPAETEASDAPAEAAPAETEAADAAEEAAPAETEKEDEQ